MITWFGWNQNVTHSRRPLLIELSALMLRSIRLHNYVKCLWFNFDSPELLLSFKVSKTTIYQILCFLTKINSSAQPQKVFSFKNLLKIWTIRSSNKFDTRRKIYHPIRWDFRGAYQVTSLLEKGNLQQKTFLQFISFSSFFNVC